MTTQKLVKEINTNKLENYTLKITENQNPKNRKSCTNPPRKLQLKNPRQSEPKKPENQNPKTSENRTPKTPENRTPKTQKIINEKIIFLNGYI